jgi:hypothetical protein
VYAGAGELPPTRFVIPQGQPFAAGKGIVYALNGDGSLRWSLPLDGRVYAGPAVGPDERLFVASWDHHLYCIQEVSERDPASSAA